MISHVYTDSDTQKITQKHAPMAEYNEKRSEKNTFTQTLGFNKPSDNSPENTQLQPHSLNSKTETHKQTKPRSDKHNKLQKKAS